jgi:hypothetical protein
MPLKRGDVPEGFSVTATAEGEAPVFSIVEARYPDRSARQVFFPVQAILPAGTSKRVVIARASGPAVGRPLSEADLAAQRPSCVVQIDYLSGGSGSHVFELHRQMKNNGGPGPLKVVRQTPQFLELFYGPVAVPGPSALKLYWEVRLHSNGQVRSRIWCESGDALTPGVLDSEYRVRITANGALRYEWTLRGALPQFDGYRNQSVRHYRYSAWTWAVWHSDHPGDIIQMPDRNYWRSTEQIPCWDFGDAPTSMPSDMSALPYYPMRFGRGFQRPQQGAGMGEFYEGPAGHHEAAYFVGGCTRERWSDVLNHDLCWYGNPDWARDPAGIGRQLKVLNPTVRLAMRPETTPANRDLKRQTQNPDQTLWHGDAGLGISDHAHGRPRGWLSYLLTGERVFLDQAVRGAWTAWGGRWYLGNRNGTLQFGCTGNGLRPIFTAVRLLAHATMICPDDEPELQAQLRQWCADVARAHGETYGPNLNALGIWADWVDEQGNYTGQVPSNPDRNVNGYDARPWWGHIYLNILYMVLQSRALPETTQPLLDRAVRWGCRWPLGMCGDGVSDGWPIEWGGISAIEPWLPDTMPRRWPADWVSVWKQHATGLQGGPYLGGWGITSNTTEKFVMPPTGKFEYVDNGAYHCHLYAAVQVARSLAVAANPAAKHPSAEQAMVRIKSMSNWTRFIEGANWQGQLSMKILSRREANIT